MEEGLSEKMWLSCPFCGESDTSIEKDQDCEVYRAICVCCESKGPDRYTQNDARKAWNTRFNVWPSDEGTAPYEGISLDDREEYWYETEEKNG